MTRILDYVGAGARLDPARGLRLPGRWGWQPKTERGKRPSNYAK